MTIAFFDLDKTLICSNSARLWVFYELRHGFIGHVDAARAMAWFMRYKLGSSSLDGAMREAIGTLRGSPADALEQRFVRFYHEQVRHLVRPGARAAMQAHRRAGHRLVLLTSTSNFLARAVCHDLGFDDYVCTQLEVDDVGQLTGRAVEPLCFGAGKLHRAEQWADQCAGGATAVADSTFYTDSASDIPVLQAVQQPVCVNPDPRLRLRARRQGWQIQDWGRPSAHRPA